MNKKLLLFLPLIILLVSVAYASDNPYPNAIIIFEADGDCTTDNSSYHNTATLSGTVTLDGADYKVGTGSCDTASTGSIKFPSSAPYTNMLSLTVEGWFKSANDEYVFHYMDTSTTNPDDDGEFNGFTSPDQWRSQYNAGGTQQQYSLSPTVMDDADWTHFAYVINTTGGNTHIYSYVNGVEKINDTISGKTRGSVARDFYLSRSHVSTDEDVGRFDSIALYNKSLTTDEIAYRYNSGDGRLNIPDAPIDTTFPTISAGFNISIDSIIQDDILNFSGNLSDDVALSVANMSYNMSGDVTFINFTISGLTYSVSNTTKVEGEIGDVINFSIYAEDSSGNVHLNSTLIIVQPPPPPEFNLSVVDTYDNATINNFNVMIFNSTDVYINTTTTGYRFYDNLTGLYNISVNATDGGYFNRTFGNVNVSSDFAADLYQVILYVNVSEAITGDKINTFIAATPLQVNNSNATGWAKLFLKAGKYNISANSTGYLDGWQEIDLIAMGENYTTVILGTANLTVDAFSIISGNTISDFSINLTEIIIDYEENRSTDNGSLIFKVVEGTYNLSIEASGYASTHQVITIPVGAIFPNATFSLYTQNSINITIYNEETQKIINDTTTTLVFDHNISRETISTDNGTLYKDDLFDGLWDIAASTDHHYQKHYFITITPNSHNTLNIWLLNTTSGALKTFNIKNQKDEPLEDVLMTVTNKVNASYVTVAQKYSDVAGQINVFMKSTTEYRIMLEADGYTTKIFDLEPSLASYNIVMASSEEIPFTTVYNKVSYTILPNSSIIGSVEELNLSIIASSEGGYISYFGLNTTFNGAEYKTNISGSVGGGTASIILNTSNITGVTIPVDHFIKLSDEDLITIHKTYYNSNITAGNYSAVSFAEKYKDDFTAVMKAIISVLVAVAIIATFAELGVPAAISGIVGALILIGFSIMGWLPYLITAIIAIIIIGMFIIKRGD